MTIRNPHRISLAALAIGGLLLISASAQQPPATNVIRVEISGFQSDKGQVICSLLSSASGFPSKSEQAIGHAKPAIANRSAVCEFAGVQPGRNAISVVHDENSNGKMDTNFVGRPKEGMGASNDAKGHMGPPKFDAAAFQFAGGRLNLKINLFYL